MKFIHSDVEFLEQAKGLNGLLKHIELAGRVSYKSEDMITVDSAQKFIKMLIDRGHTSALEHGTVYLVIPDNDIIKEDYEYLLEDPYTFVHLHEGKWYFTTNYRVIIQHNLEDLLKYMTDMQEHHVPRYTYRVICSRGVSHELVRHRVMSFTQESTRYCNYSKDKHGKQLTFIIPAGVEDLQEGDTFTEKDLAVENVVKLSVDGIYSPQSLMLVSSAVCCEKVYMGLLEQGWTPQQARDVLTNGIKTEVVVTATLPQWREFFALRSPMYGAKGVHPDMAVVADSIYTDMMVEGRIENKLEQNEPQAG